MSQQVRTELETKTQQLLQGPLKHIRAAALAAALLPLASVAAAPASAQTCASGGVVGGLCGFVYDDTNKNGIQDAGELGIPDVKVLVGVDGDTIELYTNSSGFYSLWVTDGTYPIAAEIPVGDQPSPFNVGSNDSLDSDGVSDGHGLSVTTVTVVNGYNSDTDFGFVSAPPSVLNPGTGTPGYWKNHQEAWPVDRITVGGREYLIADAINWLGRVGKDKTTTMFSSLVSAKLNKLIGNDGSCVNSTIIAADAWMQTYGPVGSGVLASSPAWVIGEPLHKWMDAYNNGLLPCAPHRN